MTPNRHTSFLSFVPPTQSAEVMPMPKEKLMTARQGSLFLLAALAFMTIALVLTS